MKSPVATEFAQIEVMTKISCFASVRLGASSLTFGPRTRRQSAVFEHSHPRSLHRKDHSLTEQSEITELAKCLSKMCLPNFSTRNTALTDLRSVLGTPLKKCNTTSVIKRSFPRGGNSGCT